MRRLSFVLLASVAVGSCSPTGDSGTGPTVAVATVTVAPSLDTVYIGAISQLAATTRDADGNVLTGRTITWSRTGTGANVSASGLVTGVSTGEVTVTATSEGVQGNAAIVVRPVPVVSVIVTPPTDTIYLGAVATFTATPRDSIGGTLPGRTATWSSLDAAASVNNIGVVTSLALGTARIVASVEGKADTSVVTFLPVPVASVVVTPAADTLYPTNTTQLTVVTRDSANGILTGRTIAWSSLDAAASVSNAGLVTAVSVGTARIVAVSEGKADTALITVQQVPVASVVIAPDSARVFITATAQLSATTKDSAGGTLIGRVVAWSSLDAAASVSGTGLVTGVSQGTARIVAASEGKADTVPVTVVTVPVASVVIAPASPTLHTRETLQLTVTTKDSAANVLTGRVVTWLSFDTTVVTVSGSGLITPRDTGDTFVSATSEGKADTVPVHVTAPPVGSVVITPSIDTVVVGDSIQLTAAVLDTAGAPLSGRPVGWSSLDTTAFVGSSNFVIGVTPGIARIVATSEGHADTATVLVVAAPPPLPPLTGRWDIAGTSSLDGPYAFAADLIQSGTILSGTSVGDRGIESLDGTVTGDSVSVLFHGATPDSSCDALWTARRVGSDSLSGTFVFIRAGCTKAGNNGPMDAHRSLAPASVASVTLTPDSAALTVGDTLTFTATVRDSANNVLLGRTSTWSSLDGYASVSTAGLVTALAAGTARIVATSEGRADTAVVTVSNAVSLPPMTGHWYAFGVDSTSGSVSVDLDLVQTDSVLTGNWQGVGASDTGPVTGTLVGTTYSIVFHNVNRPAGDCEAAWDGSRAGPDSLVGHFQFFGASCPFPNSGGTLDAIRTSAPVAVASVVVTPGSAALTVGDTLTFAAVVRDSANNVLVGRTISWSTLDGRTSVTQGGLVTALSAGTDRIVASSEGKADTANITVTAGGGGGSPLGGTWIGIVNDTSGSLAFTFVQIGSALTGSHVDLENVNPGSIDGVVDGDSVTILVHHIRIGSGYCEGTWSAARVGPDSLVGDLTFSGAGGCNGSANIVATRKTGGTGVVGPFDISVTSDRENVHGVATDGKNALLVYQKGPADTTAGDLLFARLVDSTGVTLGGEVALGTSGDPPGVAYGNGMYLAAWWLPHNDVVAQRFDSTGAPLGGIFTVASSDGSGNIYAVCGVARSQSVFLVTFQRYTGELNTAGDSLFKIFGRTVVSNGVLESEFQISDGFGQCDMTSGMVGVDHDGYFAVWTVMDSVNPGANAVIRGRSVAENHALGAVHVLASLPGGGGLPTIASRSDGGWVVGWNQMTDTLGNGEGYVRMLDPDGTPSGAAVQVAPGADPTFAQVARWSGGWSVVYLDRPSSAASSVAKIRFYTPGGTPVGNDITLATVDGSGQVPYSFAAADGVGRTFVSLDFLGPGTALLRPDQVSGDIRGVWVRP